MFEKRLIFCWNLIALFSTVVCRNNLLVSRRNLDSLTYCVTDSEYAIVWLTDNEENLKQNSTLLPNPEKLLTALNSTSNIWYIKKSLEWNINEVIVDRRWENFEPVRIKNKNQLGDSFALNLNQNFDIPFSLRAWGTVYLSFCDAPSLESANCYILSLSEFLGKSQYKIQRCTDQKSSNLVGGGLNCNHTLNETTNDSFGFSSNYWSHFKVSKAENELSLNYFDGDNYHKLVHAVDRDSDTINTTNMRIYSEGSYEYNEKSYYKIHNVEFLYTDQEANNIFLTNCSINSQNSELCISLFVVMCDFCQLKLTITKDDKIFVERVYGPKITNSWHSMWFHINFLFENLEEGEYTVLISTIGNNKKQFWAFDKIRECKRREYRTLTSYTETDCQLMDGSNNTVSLKNMILKESEDQCDRANFGGVCAPHWWLYKSWNSGIQYCSTYNGKGKVCSCVSGFTLASNCSMKCNEQFYGYNCKNKCQCLGTSNPTCHYITGMCHHCPSNYTGLECNIKIPPLDDLLTYAKDNNSISLRWKLPVEIYDEIYDFIPNKYVINYSNGENTSTLSINNSKKNRCQLWPEFLCLKLINLKNNTDYTVKIQVEYFHSSDFFRVDYSPVSIVKTRTITEPSEAPYDLKMIWNEENFLTLEWKHPNQSNGIISYFLIRISTSTSKEEYTRRIKVNQYNLTYQYEIDHPVPPATTYITEISAYNGHEGKKLIKLDISPPDVPSLVGQPQTACSNDLITVTIKPKRPKGSLRTLYKLFVYISSDYFSEYREKDKFEMKKTRLVVQCNVTNFDQNITLFIGNVSQPQMPGCYKVSNNLLLNSETPYNITIVLKNSFRNMHRSKMFSLVCLTGTVATKNPSKNPYLIIGISITNLILMVLVVTLFVYRRRKQNEKSVKKTKHFLSHLLQNIITNVSRKVDKKKEKFNNFEDLYSKPVTLNVFNNYVAECEESKEFEQQHEMVVAKFIEDVYEEIIGEYFDYINMIFTRSEAVPKAYIATELVPEIDKVNFWKDVWNNNVQHIVLQEHIDKNTCKKYWPENQEKMNCDGISVQLAFSKTFQNYYYRKFIMIYEYEIRQVDQVHLTYTGIDPKKYVPFFKRILKFPLNSQSPILIHSSHGIDRVGLILLCDMSLRMAEQEQIIDVWKILNVLAKYKVELAGNSLEYRFAHSIILKCLLDENWDDNWYEEQENTYYISDYIND